MVVQRRQRRLPAAAEAPAAAAHLPPRGRSSRRPPAGDSPRAAPSAPSRVFVPCGPQPGGTISACAVWASSGTVARRKRVSVRCNVLAAHQARHRLPPSAAAWEPVGRDAQRLEALSSCSVQSAVLPQSIDTAPGPCTQYCNQTSGPAPASSAAPCPPEQWIGTTTATASSPLHRRRRCRRWSGAAAAAATRQSLPSLRLPSLSALHLHPQHLTFKPLPLPRLLCAAASCPPS